MDDQLDFDLSGGRTGKELALASWRHMIRRCTDPKSNRWALYGGRGIEVCPRWLHFEQFYEDMGDRPGPSYELDRLDPDDSYFPGNTRWLEKRENSARAGRRSIPLVDLGIPGLLPSKSAPLIRARRTLLGAVIHG